MDELFMAFIATAQKGLQSSDADLAAMLRVSTSTINRWKRGISTPHHLAMQAVVLELYDRLEEKGLT